MEALTENAAAEATVQQPKKGGKGLPKGVSPVQGRRAGAPVKYQARVAYKPDGESKVKQRGLGTFDTIEEAAAAVADAEAKLAAGMSPWDGPQRTNKHARGEVRSLLAAHHTRSSHKCQCSPMLTGAPSLLQAPPPERKTARRWGVITTSKSHKKGASKDKKEERDPQLPTSVPLPSRIEDINDPGMRAMWEMDGEAPPEPLGV